MQVDIIRRDWEPEDLFGHLDGTDIPAREKMREVRRAGLWRDTYAEYDSRRLHAEILRIGIVRSDEARAFLDAWAADERRHTKGFIRLLELTADVEPETAWMDLHARPSDFSQMDTWLQDEFSALLVLAFDEIVTCHAYSSDREFYAAMGNDAYLRWFREVLADEATHYSNAIKVIGARHRHRIGEAKAMFEDMTRVRDIVEYQGTFVLDHFGEGYSTEMLQSCRKHLLRTLERAAHKECIKGAPME